MKRFLLFLSLGMVTLAIYMPGEEFPQDIFNISDERIETDAGQWCDEVLGCLQLTDEWYGSGRPYNVLPLSRAAINTSFVLQTREAPGDFYISANSTLVDISTFDHSRPTAFVIHGFLDNGHKKWVKELAGALLSYKDCNVITVDWGGGSRPMYFQAAANTRVVGLEIANLVNFLAEEHGLDRSKVHLIGHSLGSHISGYAGERIPGLGRISGLDPAGPYFTGMPPVVRLDPTDAIFVDAIHSDAKTILLLGYGTEESFSHLDFYPNSGRDQPGCDPTTVTIEAITAEDLDDAQRVLVSCNHQRAITLFTESLTNPNCSFVAYECPDYESFTAGQCASCGADNSNCAYMGIRADEYPHKERENVKLYLETDKESAFCYFHYEALVDLASPSEARGTVVGSMVLWLQAANGRIDNLQITQNHERMYHGETMRFLFTSHQDVTNVNDIDALWKYDTDISDPSTYCLAPFCNRALYVKSIAVSPLNHIPEEVRLADTKTCCGDAGHVTKITSGGKGHFSTNGSCMQG